MNLLQDSPGISFFLIVALALVASPILQRLIGRVALRMVLAD
ncbi:hypothetical protein [Nioella aestuarii]